MVCLCIIFGRIFALSNYASGPRQLLLLLLIEIYRFVFFSSSFSTLGAIANLTLPLSALLRSVNGEHRINYDLLGIHTDSSPPPPLLLWWLPIS